MGSLEGSEGTGVGRNHRADVISYPTGYQFSPFAAWKEGKYLLSSHFWKALGIRVLIFRVVTIML